LFQKQFQTVTSIDIIDKEDAFAFYELEFQNDIGQKEFVDFGTLDGVLDERCCFVLGFLKF
jgi:hypothetical protein